jgi:two-component system, chemotaxis family, protein-glutamate methylesterase/glutaminase
MVAHHRWAGPMASYGTLLKRGTPLHVKEALHGERLVPGAIYLAPQGRHLELDADGKIYTHHSVRYQTVRPSADLLFASVAAHYGSRAVAVVLTGYGRDGAQGVCAIRERGGFVISQDRRTSEVSGMPSSAIETRRVDLVLPLRHIAFALTTLFAPRN